MPHNEPVSFNLGALRSDMKLTLHTVHALRIWRGRPESEDRPRIIGLNYYIILTNKMKHGAELDDPFSDWWMLKVEQRAEDAKQRLLEIQTQAQYALDSVPPTLSLGDNLSIQPMQLPLYIGSPLGFAGVRLLTDYDTLVRKLLLAHHVAAIKRTELEFGLVQASHALRSLFALAQRYRYAGVNRGDCKAQNAAWLSAVEKYGMPPPGIITGERRSEYAPPLRATKTAITAGDAVVNISDDVALEDEGEFGGIGVGVGEDELGELGEYAQGDGSEFDVEDNESFER